MKRKILWLVALSLIFSPFSVDAQTIDKEKEAVASAEAWLAMVDSGKYADSWKQASDYFKNAVKQPQWEQSLAAVRKTPGQDCFKNAFQQDLYDIFAGRS